MAQPPAVPGLAPGASMRFRPYASATHAGRSGTRDGPTTRSPRARARGFYGLDRYVRMYTIKPMKASAEFSPEPLGFFLTWTTYGSWLPGDARGWTDTAGAVRAPNHRLLSHAKALMHGEPLVLSQCQRQRVKETIQRHCEVRSWVLHALACQSQHVHVVLTATADSPATVCQQLKAWTSRILREHGERAACLWTRGYSARRLRHRRPDGSY